MKQDTALSQWLGNGGKTIGEIAVHSKGSGWELCHVQDVLRTDLEVFNRWEEARNIANYDEAVRYRPLKTAPTLRKGWKLQVADLTSLRLALDYFYPGMIGMWSAKQLERLNPVLLRETLSRQSGMYRVTQKITDEQADSLIGRMCCTETGCLKTILWRIAEDRPVTSLPPEKFDPSQFPSHFLPLLCSEACNLVIAEARKVVKAAEGKSE